MTVLTQYTYETQWQPTQEKDILRIIAEEMPETDPEGTWAYIREQILKGKIVTLGDCRFKPTSDSF
jgi:hypothetical protein